MVAIWLNKIKYVIVIQIYKQIYVFFWINSKATGPFSIRVISVDFMRLRAYLKLLFLC